MAVFLPNLVSHMFNTPLFLSEGKAEMIVAVMAGKMNIEALVNEATRIDARGLADLRSVGRAEALQFRNDRFLVPPADDEGEDDSDQSLVLIPGAAVEGMCGGRPYELTESGIAIIRIHGTLTRTWGVGPYSGSTGYDGIWVQMMYAQDDPLCRAIWFDIASPGGAVDGLMDLATGIYQMSARFGGKPIHAHAADYAHSAAYMLLAAADTSSCPELGSVGSIAALAVIFDVTKAMEKEGITAHIFRSAPRKAIGLGGIETLDQEEIDEIQADINFAGNYFQERVAAYRGLDKSAISDLQGRVYRGAEARAIGLVDDVLSEPEAWAKLEQEIAR